MKLSVAAAAIAFSGTALFFAPTAASAAPTAAKAEAGMKAGWDGTAGSKAGWTEPGAKTGMTGKAGVSTAKLETMDYDGMGGAFEEASLSKGETGETSAKLAGLDTSGKGSFGDMDSGAKDQTASMDVGGKASAEGKHGIAGKADGGETHMASADKPADTHDSSQPVETAAVSKEPVAPGAATGEGKQTFAGMGGPEEATDSYPPCRPGPGDDRCIQLYEVGGSAKA